MRVLIGTNTLLPGSGIDRVVLIQAEELVKQGHQVRLLCFETSPEVKGPFEVVTFPLVQNVNLERVRRLYPFWRPSTRRRLYEQLVWCDVIYAHQYPWSMLGVWAKRLGKRFVQLNHGVADPTSFQHWSHRIYVDWINRLALRYGQQADDVWSVSQALADEWRKMTGQMSTVWRPQEQWVEKIPVRTKEQARAELKQTAPYFLFVGRISPHKGIHLLLEVMRKVWEVQPLTELKIIGKVADENYLEKLKHQAGKNVYFLGCVSDDELGLWYQGCAAYVTAAQWEGWNLPIVEALHFGRPVVCFDLPVHREFKSPLVHLVPLQQIDAFTRTCLKLV